MSSPVLISGNRRSSDFHLMVGDAIDQKLMVKCGNESNDLVERERRSAFRYCQRIVAIAAIKVHYCSVQTHLLFDCWHLRCTVEAQPCPISHYPTRQLCRHQLRSSFSTFSILNCLPYYASPDLHHASANTHININNTTSAFSLHPLLIMSKTRLLHHPQHQRQRWYKIPASMLGMAERSWLSTT